MRREKTFSSLYHICWGSFLIVIEVSMCWGNYKIIGVILATVLGTLTIIFDVLRAKMKKVAAKEIRMKGTISGIFITAYIVFRFCLGYSFLTAYFT